MIVGRGTTILPFLIPVSMVPVIYADMMRVLLATLIRVDRKRRGPSTFAVAVAFTVTIATIAFISIPLTVAVVVTVSIVAPSIRGRGPSTPAGRPGTGPPAVAVPITVTVAVAIMVPVSIIPSARTARTVSTRRRPSFVAPDRGRRILGPLRVTC